MYHTQERSVIVVSELDFSYPGQSFRLRIPQFQAAAGECIALIGPSGSGKSTLLHLLAGLLVPAGGTLEVCQQPLQELSGKQRAEHRIQQIGLVFQSFELLEHLMVRDNLLLPYRLHNSLAVTTEVQARMREVAAELGIDSKLQRYPHQLSQGEKQRVAIGRALVTKPQLLLADEPTGNLDPDNKRRVLELMLHSVRERGMTLLMATHDHSLLDQFDTTYDIHQLNSLSAEALSG